MSDRGFVDTNVFIYADDVANPTKRDRARELIRQLIHDRSGVVSLQVLQEYFYAVTRKLGMDSLNARERVEIYARFNVVKLDPDDLLRSIFTGLLRYRSGIASSFAPQWWLDAERCTPKTCRTDFGLKVSRS